MIKINTKEDENVYLARRIRSCWHPSAALAPVSQDPLLEPLLQAQTFPRPTPSIHREDPLASDHQKRPETEIR